MLQQIKKSLQIVLSTLAIAAVPMLAAVAVPQTTYAADSTLPTIEQKDVKRGGGGRNWGCYATGTGLNSNNCGIIKLIVIITNVLSAIAGTVIVIMIIVGGIQYTSAGANPQKVSAAKDKVRNALIALFALIFMYSFLQWLIPGGIGVL